MQEVAVIVSNDNKEISDIDHFVVDNKIVEIGYGAKREQKDFLFYICI